MELTLTRPGTWIVETNFCEARRAPKLRRAATRRLDPKGLALPPLDEVGASYLKEVESEVEGRP